MVGLTSMMVQQLIAMCAMARILEGMLGSSMVTALGLAVFVLCLIAGPVWKAVSYEGSTKRLGQGREL